MASTSGCLFFHRVCPRINVGLCKWQWWWGWKVSSVGFSDTWPEPLNKIKPTVAYIWNEMTLQTLYLWGHVQGNQPIALVTFVLIRDLMRLYSLSMSLYFLRKMETWSLNRTGSKRSWEWMSGMKPNQAAKEFMQDCRWAKWSGSAQRDDFEPWKRERKRETKLQCNTRTLILIYSIFFSLLSLDCIYCTINLPRINHSVLLLENNQRHRTWWSRLTTF